MTALMEDQMLAAIAAYKAELAALQAQKAEAEGVLEKLRSRRDEARLRAEKIALQEDLAELRRQIEDELHQNAQAVDPVIAREVLSHVSALFGLVPADILGKSQGRRCVLPRHIVAHALRERGWSLPQIGRMMNRHHTSVLYMLRKIEEMLAEDSDLRQLIEGVMECFDQTPTSNTRPR